MHYYDDLVEVKMEHGVLTVIDANIDQKKQKLKKIAKVVAFLTAAGIALGAEFSLLSHRNDNKTNDDTQIEKEVDNFIDNMAENNDLVPENEVEGINYGK